MKTAPHIMCKLPSVRWYFVTCNVLTLISGWGLKSSSHLLAVERCSLRHILCAIAASATISLCPVTLQIAVADTATTVQNSASVIDNRQVNFGEFRLPLRHQNQKLSKFLGSKATVIYNLKLDDPQSGNQLSSMYELYKSHSSGEQQGQLAVLGVPTDQGYFEPDNDLTLRAKALEYFGLGVEPHLVVFDKVCNYAL